MNKLFIIMILLNSIVYAQNKQYPIPPKTKELLFYIQRNHNANTIIYDANFDKNGNLVEDEPILVYWRRYQENGQKMELRTIEKWYAYGVEWEKIKGKNIYKIVLVANKQREFWLKQLKPFNAVILTYINKKLSILNHLYIFADNTGIWPTVKYIELFGIDAKTKQKMYEKIIVD